MNNENGMRSGLPQLMRSPTSKKLSESTSAANNARPTMLPPPPGTLKRKTLMERAAEPSRPAPAPPSARPANPTVKGTSIAGVARQNSYSSSTSASTRPPSSSTAYRHVSNSSYASSISSRAPSASSMRSLSSISGSHLGHGKSKSMHFQRPPNTMDHSGSQDDTNNSIVKPSPSARQFSANTSRRKKPVLNMDGISDRDRSSLGSGQEVPARSLRDISLTNQFGVLSLNEQTSLPPPNGKENVPPSPPTPSQIPRKKPSASVLQPSPSPSPTKSLKKSPSKRKVFLNKESNMRVSDTWDLGSRVETMESMYAEMKKTMSTSADESNSLKAAIDVYKARVTDLEDMKREAARDNKDLRADLDKMRQELSTSSMTLEQLKQSHSFELTQSNQKLDEMRRSHNNEIDELERKLRRDVNQAISDAEAEKRRIESLHRDELADLKRKLEKAIEEERELRQKEVNTLSSEGTQAQQKVERALQDKELELQALRVEMERSKAETALERTNNSKLRTQLDDANSTIVSNESTVKRLKGHVEFLESDSKSQSQSFADLERKTQEAIREAEDAKAKLLVEETLRRKLHNQVQELKGNIRVFCRVRPTLPSEEDTKAKIAFPDTDEDSKELEVTGQEEKSSLGTVTTKKHAFSFDRVFDPKSQNAEIFEEISQLVQSALDGYNVCIFCYGQTGAGKTYTMSSEDGMIPRAVNQIYQQARSLEEKGWKYTMEGSFIEVYNENINDLLGKADELDKKKLEIRHDTDKRQTTVVGLTTVNLDSPGAVETALQKAMSNRSVAATKANERSSRSHSVFILKLIGENSITGERSEGTLNLVDLAGSERLGHSKAEGDRLKETQNINKSLTCLGDVVHALGQAVPGKKDHIPYRNSKLTYLLQYSLGGNSKTLMFVMVSPLQAHLSETVTSLKFATKVHNTHIGTAKRQAKVN